MKKTFKILIAAVLSVAMLMSFAFAAEANVLEGFADAPEASSWKHAGLASAVENGIMKGANGKLNPDAPLTRAELTAMMVRVLGAQQDKEDISHFIDVVIDSWYADYIKSGVAVKIINGAGNKMMPNDPVTREQAFAILARTFVLAADNAGAINSFNDAGRVSDWAKDATAALIENNIVQGGSANDIRPQANVTRAEYAAMLDRLVDTYAKPGESYAGKTIKGSIVITSADVDLTGAIIEGKVIIADAVNGSEIELKDVEVQGDLVVRAGSVKVTGAASIGNVVYGNPIHKAEVKADKEITADKVIVSENAAEVNNEVSAEKVEIKADGADVSLGGETTYTEVEVKAENVKVDVNAGAKVENATVEGTGSTVAGDGKVENVTVKPTTPSEPTKPTDPVTPSKPSDSPNIGTVPSNPTSFDISGAYVTYGDQQKIMATINGNVVKFDFTNVDSAVVLEKLYITASSKKNCVHPYATFSTNEEEDIADIIAQIIENTNDQLVVIDDVQTFDIATLTNLVTDAKGFYDLVSEIDGNPIFKDLFTADGIEISGSDIANTVTFTGKIGTQTFKLQIVLPTLQ